MTRFWSVRGASPILSAPFPPLTFGAVELSKQRFDPMLDIRSENNIANQGDRICASLEYRWRPFGGNPANRHNRNMDLLTNLLQLLKAARGLAGRLGRCAE